MTANKDNAPNVSRVGIRNPDWPLPNNVRAVYSTRLGGLSGAGYSSNNLALHVGDDENSVLQNRHRFNEQINTLSKRSVNIQWLNQIHSCDIHIAENVQARPPTADAIITRSSGLVCCIMTADCLPILVANTDGTEVAAIHAGWRGQADGIISQTLANMHSPVEALTVYIAPAISQTHFQVGEDVLAAFKQAQIHRRYAEPIDLFFCSDSGEKNKYRADLVGLAKAELRGYGVRRIFSSQQCTYSEADFFYSYRRGSPCGRIASCVWFL